MHMRTFVSLALAAALAVPAAAHAGPLSVFQPKPARPAALTPADEHGMHAFAGLDRLGTTRVANTPGSDEVQSASEASRRAGYRLRMPAPVLAAIPSDRHYEVMHGGRVAFTFEAAKAAAWARESNVALRPLPRGLDGTTYTATMAPAVEVRYGSMHESSDAHGAHPRYLVFVQGRVPVVTSDGAPLPTLADWLSAQPGIPPQLATQVRAAGDPAQALPIPIPVDKLRAKPIAVDGVEGFAFGDEPAFGNVIAWTKNGMLYLIAGTFSQTELLALVSTMK
jgi:hypothetical protein